MLPSVFAGRIWTGCLVFLAAAAGAQTLEEGFKNPPRACSMVPLWSWNGTLEPEQLRWQIDQLVDKGVYGAFMHARAGIETGTTPYFSDGWWEAVQACVTHGAEVGFNPWIYDEDKWPSGAAGGRTIAHNPERNRQKGFKIIEQRVTGPSEQKIAIPDARYVIAGKLSGERAIEPGSLVDLSGQNGGAKAWQCPKGEWLVIGYVPASGDGVNYLNKDTIRDFMNITHEEYARRVGDQFGTTIPGVFFDEIHTRGLPMVWVEGFEERFRAMKGYELPPLLPALKYDIGPMTPKVRCDYYDVFASFYEEAWFKQISAWCAEHRLELTGHTEEGINSYANQGDYFQTMRNLHIPMTDNEDFRYTWPRVIGYWKPKQIASICHLYGHERIAVEAMGGAGWSFTLDSARYGFNMLAAYGINFFYPHLFHYAQDHPTNVDDWPNSWFFRNPYWKYFKTFADHGSRLSYMLTGGAHVVEVAILYPQANLWAGYGPGTAEQALDRLVSNHIDADLMDPDSLLRAKIEDKALCVAKMRYRVLIVPGARCLRRDEAAKIRDFAKAGGQVIVHNRWPDESMDKGRDDRVIKKHMRAIEKRGIALSKVDEVVEQAAARIGRDIAISGEHPEALHAQHVQREGKEIYWLANASRERRDWQIDFRATGAAAIWQPEDGSITPLPALETNEGRTVCRIGLDGWQGCFVVFDPKKTPMSADAIPARVAQGKVVDLTNQPWQFLAVGHALDDAWRVDLEDAELELPVMKARWEFPDDADAATWKSPEYDDRDWRQVKLLDTLHPDAGADRYRSAWRARFISFYDFLQFNAAPGGKGLQCRRSEALPEAAPSGWLAVICESPFHVLLNGSEIAAGKGGTAPERFALPGLPAGEAVLTIAADNARAILAEGEWVLEDGRRIPVRSDAAWEVSMNGKDWRGAWEYVAPPEKPYGEPPHPEQRALPEVLWYRQALPRGVTEIRVSKLEGNCEAWIDGKPLRFKAGAAKLPEGASLLAMRVRLKEGEHGLMTPPTIRCRRTAQPLGSWAAQRLDWYSGRAIYAATFQTEGPPPENARFMIDLGKVCYCAEVWVNGKLAGTRVWPPYTVDITDCVQPGENRLEIVVANLLANQMQWDIFDDAKSVDVNRKWHDANIRRDAWCLESGLIGPVKLCLEP